MPQNELLDLIFACFREYNYWSMKALRQRLRQPESYLRETLEKVADLAKSGRFAMHWTLKPESKPMDHIDGSDGIAPTQMDGMDGADDSEAADLDDDDDDDDDLKMEDVL